uniref:Pecanex-like protein n=1 Tax=Macrostomum lignano TaxID=282301 RepID=A0A1I8HVL0_9PLAT
MSQHLLIGRLKRFLPCRGRKCDGEAAHLTTDEDGDTNGGGVESATESWTTGTPGSTQCRPLPQRAHRRRRRLQRSVVGADASGQTAADVSPQDCAANHAPHTSTESARTLDDEVTMGTCGQVSVASENRIVLTPKSIVQLSESQLRSPSALSNAAVAAGAVTSSTTTCNELDADRTGILDKASAGDAAAGCPSSSAVERSTASRASMRTAVGAATAASSADRQLELRSVGNNVGAAKDEQDEASKNILADCQAEICQLQSYSSKAIDAPFNDCDHSASEDLVVSEYLVQERLNLQSDQVNQVVNNALLNLQHQLKAELCELNTSNLAASNQNACEQRLPPPLIMNFAAVAASSAASTEYSGLPEPKTNASVTASAASESTVAKGGELQTSPAGAVECSVNEHPTSSGDARNRKSNRKSTVSPENKCPISCVLTSADSRIFVGDSDEPPVEAPDARLMSSEIQSRISGLPSSSELGRLGTLSSSRCTNICQALQSNVLMDRYLSKRDVSEATRIWHRQRCAYITADLVQKVLQNSVDASEVPAASSAAAVKAFNSSANNSVELGVAPSSRPPVLAVAQSAGAVRRPMAHRAPGLSSIAKKI